VASAEEEKRCRVPRLALGPGPAAQAPRGGRKGWPMALGRWWGVLSSGARGCWGTVLCAAPPRCLPGCLPLPSGERSRPRVRSPTSRRVLPGRCLLSALFCLLSHFAKCLLIFSTESRCLPRGSRVSTHYGRKHVQPPALTNSPTTNRKGHPSQHQQQVATLPPPAESSPTVRDRGMEATLPPTRRSTAPTTSRRSLPVPSPVAAQPGGQGKGGAMGGSP